jgi:hypothetical protein
MISAGLSESLPRALVPLAVLLFFALARKYFPATTNKESAQKYSIEDLDYRFRKSKWIVGLCMLGVGVAFAWSTHALFVWINRRIAESDGTAYFRLWPQTAIWWFFPGFGALALSYEITLQLWALTGHREEANLYSEWTNRSKSFGASGSAGFNSRKVLRWMGLLIAMPVGILTALTLPMHTTLRENDIRECGYALSGCSVYAYSAAYRMTAIDGFRDRDGKLNRRAGIVVEFSDGRRWNSADMSDFQDRVDPAMADFLEKKTHLPLNHVEAESDIPQADIKP